MLELIQQENWHGLTVYVAVRVAIVLICWGILGDGYFHRYVLRTQGGEGGRGRTAKQEVPPDVQQNRGLHTGYGIRPHV